MVINWAGTAVDFYLLMGGIVKLHSILLPSHRGAEPETRQRQNALHNQTA